MKPGLVKDGRSEVDRVVDRVVDREVDSEVDGGR